MVNINRDELVFCGGHLSVQQAGNLCRASLACNDAGKQPTRYRVNKPAPAPIIAVTLAQRLVSLTA